MLKYFIMECNYYSKLIMRTIHTKEHRRIVERLTDARNIGGLNQVKVAKHLGKTHSYVSEIESGQHRIDVVQLQQFAKIYKKSIDYFYGTKK